MTKMEQTHTRMTTATKNPAVKTAWIHPCAVCLAACTLAVILLGAIITSSEGLPSDSPLVRAPDWTSSLHLVTSILVSLLTVGLCLWLVVKERDSWLRIAAGATLLVWLAELALGATASSVALFHAFLAQLLMTGAVLLAVLTSTAWDSPGEISGSSFRWLALVIVVLVLLQVLLGDAYRHRAMGVILHILNAMIVALVIFISGMVLTRKSSEPTMLRSAAVWLMVITGIQVMLGFAVFILLLMLKATNISVVVISVAHVATGALTLAASVVFAIVARRDSGRPSTAGGGLEPSPSQAQP